MVGSKYALTAQTDAVADIVHVLNRLSYGPRPGDIERVRQMGIQAYIDEQLNPGTLPDPVENDERFQAIKDYGPDVIREWDDLTAQLRKAEKENDQPQMDAVRASLRTFYAQHEAVYRNAKLERAINSPRQLEEVMTDFWYNHFNVWTGKNIDRVLCGPYEEQAIRRYALGNFREMLGATCHHPAMLFYLDNWQNTAPKAKGPGLNENYARELMELHTLGVDGGYSQKDVITLARVLTGLNIAGRNRKPDPDQEVIGNSGAVFEPSRHDFSQKTLLGHPSMTSGEQEIEEVLDMLARHPATAHHVAFKLAQYFVADNPPPHLVNKLAQRFRQTDGDIKAVMQTLLASDEFWNQKYEHSKYKSPFRYVVSAIRATGEQSPKPEFINQFLTTQGQPIYGCLTPDGYKNTKDLWMNPGALVDRINLATTIGSGQLPGSHSGPPEYRELGATISDGKFTRQTVDTISKQPEELRSTLLIGSPEFMRY
jgi:uncharacterized protein (DUF1800 family)